MKRTVMGAYDCIAEGLNKTIEFACGKEIGARVHRIAVPTIGVAGIRAQTGLSQGAFAKSIGVAKGTLVNRGHGSRQPTGPAQVLLAMIAKRPSVVRELLR